MAIDNKVHANITILLSLLLFLILILPACSSTSAPTPTLDVTSTPITTTSPIILVEGRITLFAPDPPPEDVLWQAPTKIESFITWDYENAFLDLDTGELTNNEDADLYYWFSCGSMCFGHTFLINRARVSRIDNNEIAPGYFGCYRELQDVTLNPEGEFTGIYPGEGQFSCIMTNEGNLSQVKVDRVSFGIDGGSMTISFITWEINSQIVEDTTPTP